MDANAKTSVVTHYGTRRLAGLLTRLCPVLRIAAEVSDDAMGRHPKPFTCSDCCEEIQTSAGYLIAARSICDRATGALGRPLPPDQQRQTKDVLVRLIASRLISLLDCGTLSLTWPVLRRLTGPRGDSHRSRPPVMGARGPPTGRWGRHARQSQSSTP